MPHTRIVDTLRVLLLLAVITTESVSQSRSLCPRSFLLIGKKCYHFSNDEAAWHDAHFKCLNLNSSLARIMKPRQELYVRRYLNTHNIGRYEYWIGGRYNEKRSKWIWAANGGSSLVFHGFSRMNPNDQKWTWHCIIIDPHRQNKWSARSCVDQKRYICQRSALRTKRIKTNNCSKNSSINNSCSSNVVGNSAPGFLVEKTKKVAKPYSFYTFVCPSDMILVGRKCYFFSLDKANWNDAYWSCRDKKTKLAVLTSRLQDNILRGFLKGNFTVEKQERWIGGIYDWKQEKWKWAMSGRVILYTNFAEEAFVNIKNNTYHCITLDPLFNHLWNSKNRLEEKYYICQAKSKSVVKYETPVKYKPDATVIIHPGNNEETVGNDTITSSAPYYNNEVTEIYV